MPLTSFDHVNVYTTNLEALVAWYGEVLGLKPGPRPDFKFPGAWLYLGDLAVLHLVGVAEPRDAPRPGIEHFAFRATGMAAFLETLRARGAAYRLAPVPDIGIVQVNIHDPDGNHIHIDFDAAEAVA